MKKRKTSIEFMRFLAAVMVVLVHIRQIIYPDNGMAEMAFVAVEFFFMATGYYTMLEVTSEKTSGIAVEAYDTVVYVLKKQKRFLACTFLL